MRSATVPDHLQDAVKQGYPVIKRSNREHGSAADPLVITNPGDYFGDRGYSHRQMLEYEVATDEEVRRAEERRQHRLRHNQAIQTFHRELQDMFDDEGVRHKVVGVEYSIRNRQMIAQIKPADGGPIRPWAFGDTTPSAAEDDIAHQPLDEHDKGFFGKYSRADRILRDNIGDIWCGWEKTETEFALESLGDNHEFSPYDLTGARSPWGTVQHVGATGSPHIVFASTDSHGGYKLSQQANKLMPPSLRKRSGWYEEDTERHRVQVVFPAATRVGTGTTASGLYHGSADILVQEEPDKARRAGIMAEPQYCRFTKVP